MLFSLNLLKKFVEIPDGLEAKEIANLLTMKTMEIEGFEESFKYLDENVVVGEILKVEDHPEADRLKVCQVNVGDDKPLNIVCGGNNLYEGQKVAVAKIGATVSWHGEEEVRLERTKIRGIESEGMICASEELGLDKIFPLDDERAILDLSHLDWKVGNKIIDYLEKDIIFELDNKSINHRPDLWGHYGIARELSVLLDKPLKKYSDFYDEKLIDWEKMENDHLLVDGEICDHYIAVKIKNIKKNLESPLWLKMYLSNLGIKSISPLVDISNYLMLEYGEPMHIFDAKMVENEKIIVRRAKEDEKFVALNEEEYILNSNDIVVADEEKVLALGGVIGGLESGVNENTEEIILEFAHFPASMIRKSSMKHSLRTEASMRFEKALDPNYPMEAMKRAVKLIKELYPEMEVEWLAEYKNYKEEKSKIQISLNEFSRLSGVEIEEAFIVKTLDKLGFEVEKDGDLLNLTVPTWRATKDITMPIDIVEEILRIYGYDNIPFELPKVPLSAVDQEDIYILKNKVLEFFTLHARMTEVYNYSFLKLDTIKKLHGDNADLANYIYLENPVDKTRPVLRDDMIYNLLENAVENQKYFDEFRVFEIGRIFKKHELSNFDVNGRNEEFLPWQNLQLAGFIYSDKDNDLLIYDLKSEIEALFQFLAKSYIIDIGRKKDYFHPYQSLIIKVKNKDEWIEVAELGIINPFVLENFDIKGKVAYFNVDLDLLVKSPDSEKLYHEISKYPAIDLDISLLINKDVLWQDIKNFIEKESDLIKNIKLIDLYESEEWEKDNLHSLTFRLTYQSAEKTLEMEELNKLHEDIKNKLKIEFSAIIR